MNEASHAAQDADQEDLVLLADGDIGALRLNHAMKLLRKANSEAEEVDGKRYTTVAQRVEVFRRAFGVEASILTEVHHVDNDVVRVKASIRIFRGGTSVEVATGHAEEWRDSSEVNMTSALENAETSAIGRALASLGIHGGQFATADEVRAARAEVAAAQAQEAVSLLTADEVTDAVRKINACTTEAELSETYVRMSPARKAATRELMHARLRAIRNNAQKSGSEPEKAGSPPPRSEPQQASRQRRARSNGGA